MPGEVDWVVTTPYPIALADLVRGEKETDAEWEKTRRDFAPIRMSFDFDHRKWTLANKKCLNVVNNTIEPTLWGSISECDTMVEYL